MEKARLYPEVYAPRASEGVNDSFDVLARKPEQQLSEAEKQELLLVEEDIANGCYGKDKEQAITGWHTDKSIKIDFIIQYFETDEGIESFRMFTEENSLSPTIKFDVHSICEYLAGISIDINDNNSLKMSLKRLAKKSHDYLANWVYENSEGYTDVDHFTVHSDYKSILSSIEKTRKVRDDLRLARVDIKKREDLTNNLKEALLTLVGIYMQKTAQRLGELYPDYIDLYQIALTLPVSNSREKLLSELQASQEHMFIVAQRITDEEESSAIEERFAWGMDHWRQGVVKGDVRTAITTDLENFIFRLESDNGAFESDHSPIFSQEEIDALESRKYNASDIKNLAEYILSENGVLSSSNDYVQGEWPNDSTPESPKIGVSVGPYDNMKYSKGWLLIPEGISRKGFQQSPSGAFLVVAHEIEHAIDGITAYRSKGLKLNELTSRGSTTIREGIGKAIEIEASRRLIGVDILPSRTYYKALLTWLDTGNEIEAIKAFARQAAEESGLERPTKSQISNAENRVQRLIGKHGINTQALVYIEQALLAEVLGEYPIALKEYLACNSGLDVRSQALLHKFGILETKRYLFSKSIIDCVAEYIKTKII